MKVVSLALLYLGSVSLFGVEAAPLDIMSDFKRKWSSWRARRDQPVALTASQAAALEAPKLVAGSPAAAEEKPALTARDLENSYILGTGKRSARSLDRLRAKRQHLSNAVLEKLREKCQLGTCMVHNLGYIVSHFTNTELDTAPPDSTGPEGYGRRRRRSLLDAAAASSSSSGRRSARGSVPTRQTEIDRIIQQILHFMNKEKGTAPPVLMGPSGFGRRRAAPPAGSR